MGIILLGLMWIIFVGPVILIDIQAYRGEGDSSFVKLVFMNTAGLFFGLMPIIVFLVKVCGLDFGDLSPFAYLAFCAIIGLIIATLINSGEFAPPAQSTTTRNNNTTYTNTIPNNTNTKAEKLRSEIKTRLDNKVKTIANLESRLKSFKFPSQRTGKLVELICNCAEENALREKCRSIGEQKYNHYKNYFDEVIPLKERPLNFMELEKYTRQQLKKKQEYKNVLNKLNTYSHQKLEELQKIYK